MILLISRQSHLVGDVGLLVNKSDEDAFLVSKSDLAASLVSKETAVILVNGFCWGFFMIEWNSFLQLVPRGLVDRHWT
jgi:hypothetical protein